MKRLSLFISIILLCGNIVSKAQGFWFLTYEFPPQLKTTIALLNDSTIAVGSVEGIHISDTEGRSWKKILSSSPIFSIAHQGDTIVATGRGRIFSSADNGISWDSTLFESNAALPVVKALPNGGFIAISGDISLAEGFVGSGVWYSASGLGNWQQRNNGLSALSCGHLAISENGSIFITVNDELANRVSGLYMSDNHGETWREIPLLIDGRNAVESTLYITQSTALQIINDSLYCSFRGIARAQGKSGVSVQLNVRKHFDDVDKPTNWDVYQVSSSGSWWLDRPLCGIFRAHNGDMYASVTGSINSGGTYFAPSGGNWQFITTGLGVDIGGGRSEQSFVQDAKSRIFMVHVGDERVYTTSRSMPVSVPLPSENVFSVYPHPASIQQPIRFSVPEEFIGGMYELLSITGIVVAKGDITTTTITGQSPTAAGMYILKVSKINQTRTQKVMFY